MMNKNYAEVFGALIDKIDIRDYKLDATTACAAEFPEEFELPVVKVKNQGSVGSCVAHSIAEVVEYHNKKQNKVDIRMSTGFIYGNRRNSTNKASGMYTREALSNTCKYGDAFWSDFSENKEVPEAIDLFEERFDSLKDKAFYNRFSTYFRVYSDNDIKYALMNYGPVVFIMHWYSDIAVNTKCIITTTCKKQNIVGNHCMIIYGWDKDGWKIQNSWGTLWGKSGRAILPYNIERLESWGVTDEVTDDNPDIKKTFFNTTFLKIIVKIINFILNIFKKKK